MAGFIQLLLLSHPNKIFNLWLFLIAFFLFHTTCLQAHLLCPQEQSSALLLFKSQFSFDKSASSDCDDSYLKLKSWKEGTDCCSWDGVECDTETSQVVGLDLSCSWLQLKGTIHPNNTLFHHHFPPNLHRLNLAFNDFNYSRIPSAFTQLTQLTHLNLSSSVFSGQVPIEFSFLNKLVSLDLSYNYDLRLQGIGFELLVQNLTKIRELHLNEVNISTVFPNSLLNLTSLTYLELWGCGFYGKFLPGIFQLPHLKGLDLENNMNLTGYFPKFMNSSSPLQSLHLSYTSLSGELPDTIGNLKSLEVLDASSCQFYGSIPVSLGNLTKLTLLYLSYNNFTGMLPSSFSNLINLNTLSFSDNHLYGSIPTSLGNLTKITLLYLSCNNFTGMLPSSFSNLINLSTLSFSDNHLYGSIPISLGNLTKIVGLNLSYNDFTGMLPSSFSNLVNLESLDLSNNHFHGKIANVLPSSKVLSYLNLCSNNFSGPLPFENLTGLEFLYATKNRLTGPLPMQIIGLPVLSVIQLYLNLINGSIPTWIFTLPSLGLLDLSYNEFTGSIKEFHSSSLQAIFLNNNNLHGTIPSPMLKPKNLLVLNLQKNKFFGTIPDTFAIGSQLTAINFNGNRFVGTIPKSLVNCRRLEVLDLGSNMFFDEFPHWLDNLPDLHVLILRSNKFHGPILASKTKLPFPKLRLIDMSKNNFNGPLPKKYLENFKALMNMDEVNSQLQYVTGNDQYQDYYSLTMVIKGLTMEMEKVLTIFAAIDLSQNNFQGEISEAIGWLNSIRGLNLSHNILSGHIPASLGNLTKLEWLDLSSNKLTGKIPQTLTNLGFLQVLNLSRNQLTGPIPQGKQFDTFLNDSYIDNLALCGTPLSNACSNTITPEPPSSIFEDSQSSSGFFNWEVILPGYGCGLVFGISMGYLMFSTGKPQWFVRIIERAEIESRKRPKKVTRRHRGRRN